MSLSTLIVQREIATIREVEEALARQVLYGGDLVTNLLEVCHVEEAALMPVVAEAFGLPPAPPGELPKPSAEAHRLVAPEVANERNLAPISADRSGLVVAVAAPLPRDVEQELAFALALPIVQRIAPLVRIRQALMRDYALGLDRRFDRLLSRLLGDRGSFRPSSVPTMHAPAELRTPPRPPSAMPEMPKRKAASPGRPVSSAPGELPTTLLRDREVPPPRPQRRRRGPLTSDVARKELEEAGERDTIFDLVFEFARQFFDYTVLFTVHGESAEGRDSYGDGAPRERVARIGVPLDLPGILSMALAQKTAVVKAPAPDGLDALLWSELERRGRTECVVLPVVVRKRVVALVLGDGGADGVDPKSLSEVKKVVDKASSSFERMIVRRKLRGDERGATPGGADGDVRDTAVSDEPPTPRRPANVPPEAKAPALRREEPSLPPVPEPAPAPFVAEGASRIVATPANEPERTGPRHASDAKADAVAAARHALPLEPASVGVPTFAAPPIEVVDRPSIEELAAPIRELMNEAAVSELEIFEREPGMGLTLDTAALHEAVTLEPGPPSMRVTVPPDPHAAVTLEPAPLVPAPAILFDGGPNSTAATMEPAAPLALPAEAYAPVDVNAAVTIQPAPSPVTVEPYRPTPGFEPLPENFGSTDSLVTVIERGRSDNPPPPTNLLAVRRPSGAPIPREEPELGARPSPASVAPSPAVLASAIVNGPASTASPPSTNFGPASGRGRLAGRRAEAPPLDFAPTRSRTPAFGSEFGNDAVERQLLAEIHGRVAPSAKANVIEEAAISQQPPTQVAPAVSVVSVPESANGAPASSRSARASSGASSAPVSPPASSLASDAVALAERDASAPDLSPIPLALATVKKPSLVIELDPEATPIAPEIDPDPTPIAPGYVLSVGADPVSVPSPNAPLAVPVTKLPAVAAANPSKAAAVAARANAWPFPVTKPMPASEQVVSVAPHRPPSSRNDETRALPSIIVDMASQYVSLVDRVIAGADDEAEAALLRAGNAAMAAILAKFPGPLTVEAERLAGSVWPRASECGPVLRLVASQRRTALPSVLALVEDADVEKRFWATYLLSELVYADSIDPVFRRAFDDEPRVRKAARLAARAVAEVHPAAMVDPFETASREAGAPRARRLLAIEALGETREPMAISSLIPLLDDGAKEIVGEARKALVLVARQDFGESRSKWETWWRENGDRHRLEWLIDALMHDQAVLRAAAGEELKTITKEYFGYYDDLPKRERERAQTRYRDWWNNVGRVRFNRDAARG